MVNLKVNHLVKLVQRALSPIYRRRIAVISAENRQSEVEDGCYAAIVKNAGIPPPWDGGVADPLETRYSPTCVIIPNFVALGQTLWA